MSQQASWKYVICVRIDACCQYPVMHVWIHDMYYMRNMCVNRRMLSISCDARLNTWYVLYAQNVCELAHAVSIMWCAFEYVKCIICVICVWTDACCEYLVMHVWILNVIIKDIRSIYVLLTSGCEVVICTVLYSSGLSSYFARLNLF